MTTTSKMRTRSDCMNKADDIVYAMRELQGTGDVDAGEQVMQSMIDFADAMNSGDLGKRDVAYLATSFDECADIMRSLRAS